MITSTDRKVLSEIGISESDIINQIELLNRNNSFLNITDAAVPENGIVVLDNSDKYYDIYNKRKSLYHITKFVPASGAATRMFKRLIKYSETPEEHNFTDGESASVKTTINSIDRFAFYNKIKEKITSDISGKQIADLILYEKLEYASLPKGLLDFHLYGDNSFTSFEEHLAEAVEMGEKDSGVDIHLTISREHLEKFMQKLEEAREKASYDLNVSFSFQESSTNTVALNHDGELVRNEDGSLLLRPGGHGALIKNLNKIDSDIIFIKNIDNVVHQDYLSDTIRNKKVLGGVLIDTVEKIREYHKLLNQETVSEDVTNEVLDFCKNKFGFEQDSTCELNGQLLRFLNRPVRVCGMVKNTGEPGGGPFWVEKSGRKSLQIVEKAQIDISNKEHEDILKRSTHFNPVDLVCYLKDPNGKQFNLDEFVDKNACFVSGKSFKGKDIRVLEHPGLWNGAMANWLTIFVEVPLETFNPVKELNDLLKKMHQPKS